MVVLLNNIQYIVTWLYIIRCSKKFSNFNFIILLSIERIYN